MGSRWRAWLLLPALLAGAASHAQEALQPGMTAPDFSLPDSQARARRLADWRGQWLVLYFYPKDDTPGCTREAINFRDRLHEFAALNARVVGVSLDDAESHRAFADRQRLPFPLLTDAGGQVARRYGALTDLGVVRFAKRHSFLIDPQGRIAKIYRQVDAAGHAAELLADLKVFQG